MRLPSGLYGIADAGFGDPVELGALWLEGGARALQLRCKGWSQDQVAHAAEALWPRCRAAGVPLIINDWPALVQLADGVHLGQGDGPLPEAPGKLRGRSTHSLAQLHAAAAEGADHVGFGPVFGTATKVGALPARGVPMLAQVVAAARVPVIAIGGVGPANLAAVKATGAQAWAVISAVLGAEDVVAAARAVG
ncbi:MAG: thiamine phosphate synthase [Alphaproteobacteria bacterium]|nr:thiamine phosphate synthase [Alphaproteobacteria bacterium]